ncbi:hypothetical protein CI610_02603 [invertebrate metagenome]|uniref:Autotransporter domain-containing protein n=1 Tax=invertebrate metagenome TaxID=1711999 RepID=A0A2H9T5G3_9ZZZZ
MQTDDGVHSIRKQSYLFQVQPMAGLNYSLVHQESYREKDTGNTGFAQKVNAETFQQIEADLGVSLSSDWILGG